MRTRTLLLLICCIGWLPQTVSAKKPNKLVTLIRISDLIIIGQLEKGLTDSSIARGQDYTIVEAEYIWGDPLGYIFPERRMEELIRFRSGSREVPQLDAITNKASTKIWFLRRSADKSSPLQYFGVAPINKEKRIRKYLAENSVILRHAVGNLAWGTVELILRNATISDLHIPEVEIKERRIAHSPIVSLTFHLLDADGDNELSVEPIPGQVQLLDDQDWLLLQPGEERVLRFNISDNYPLMDERAYRLGITIDGVGSGTLVIGQPAH